MKRFSGGSENASRAFGKRDLPRASGFLLMSFQFVTDSFPYACQDLGLAGG